jgi:hypothetical protein
MEGHMMRSKFGFLAGIAGAALATWWFRNRQISSMGSTIGHEKGEVIFRNTPLP